MFDIPRESHRYLIEELTERPHLKSTLIKMFLSFTEQIMNSSKVALKCLYNILKYDTQSVTGFNLRKIMLLLEKTSIDELKPSDANEIKYFPVPDSESWKIDIINEITDIKFGIKSLHDFPHEELDAILNNLCIT